MNNDLIRRSDLKAAVDDICYSWGEETEVEGYVLIALVDKLPAVDAEVVRHGRWIPVMESTIFGQEFEDGHECSVCGSKSLYSCADYVAYDELSNYCPNCGARMDAEVQE